MNVGHATKAPFAGAPVVHVQLPDSSSQATDAERIQLDGLRPLLEEHRVAIEHELGAPFVFAEGGNHRWMVGPAKYNSHLSSRKPATSPEIYLDRDGGILICDGASCSEVMETFSYLRSLGTFAGGVFEIACCKDIHAAVKRIQTEIATSYPAFRMRSLDWERICAQFIPQVIQEKETLRAIHRMQEWVASLEDGHTWVRPSKPYAELPYGLLVSPDKATFIRVPRDTLGWQAGLRPGFELQENDLATWWRRTASTAHAKSLVVGRRIFSVPVGTVMDLKARSPEGREISWRETPVRPTWDPVAQWRCLPSGFGYIKISAWLLGCELDEQIDQAFLDFQHLPMIIVDLRGNPGGNLVLAQSFRNRFLKKIGPLGWIQNTVPDGSLSPLRSIVGMPAEPRKSWLKKVRFLTDALTYSASEDALLGLQGQAHVQVVGQRSGGGSGRVRKLRLFDDWDLTISTSLTYDLSGNCIEGAGIPVDIPVPFDWKSEQDMVLERAQKF